MNRNWYTIQIVYFYLSFYNTYSSNLIRKIGVTIIKNNISLTVKVDFKINKKMTITSPLFFFFTIDTTFTKYSFKFEIKGEKLKRKSIPLKSLN